MSADIRNHPVLVHCNRGKVWSTNQCNSLFYPIMFLYITYVNNSQAFLLFFFLNAAPDWLSDRVFQEAAELVRVLGVRGVCAVCCCQGQGVRPEVYWEFWCLIREAMCPRHHLPIPGMRLPSPPACVLRCRTSIPILPQVLIWLERKWHSRALTARFSFPVAF